MKKVEKYIIIVLSVITVAVIGTALYFGANSTNIKDDNNKVVDINKEDVKNPDNNQELISKEDLEENKEAIAFCEANKDKIYKKIIENRNSSLASKYDKKLLNNLYKLSSKDDLKCNYAVDNGNSFYKYLLYFENLNETLSDYVVFDENLMLKEYITTIDDDYEINESFAMSLSYEIIGNKLVDTNDMYYSYILNIYDKDLVLLEAVNYDVENQNSGISKLLSLYLVDLKTKTYEKLK